MPSRRHASITKGDASGTAVPEVRSAPCPQYARTHFFLRLRKKWVLFTHVFPRIPWHTYAFPPTTLAYVYPQWHQNACRCSPGVREPNSRSDHQLSCPSTQLVTDGLPWKAGFHTWKMYLCWLWGMGLVQVTLDRSCGPLFCCNKNHLISPDLRLLYSAEIKTNNLKNTHSLRVTFSFPWDSSFFMWLEIKQVYFKHQLV